MQDRAETAMPLFSLFSGGTAHGCTEDDDYDVDDVEVLQLVSLIDSRRRPEGSSGARCKTTGARAEARAVGTTQPLAPEVSFGHLGHQALHRQSGPKLSCSIAQMMLKMMLFEQ